MTNSIRKLCVLAFLTLPLCPTFAQGQAATQSQSSETLISIGGEVEHPCKLTAADIAKLPRRTVRAADHGKEATFEGVPLVEVLRLAGVKFGEGLRGKNLQLYLLVEAADGYKAVFALPELDPAFTDRIILLADRRDDKPLSSEEGRLRVVVPDEKRPARWVRQVITLTIKRAE